MVQLGDFGIAAHNAGGVSVIEDVGTLVFQAPEILQGHESDSRIDIWGLGCVLFSILSFDYPFWA